MEAVPKIPLISFELKTSAENTQFGPKLKQYIAEAYKEDAESYNNEIHKLESLRSAAVRCTSDAAGLSALIRYFCQLRAIQSRFPMAKGQPVACTFAWKELYENTTCSVADIQFEMASIMYNIGALNTQLGASEPRNSADSMKAACTHYQNAAWAFQYIREHYHKTPGIDLCEEIMRLLQEICFAQAQECILEKSIQDTRKPSVVGAVATQVLYFYKNSMTLLGSSTSSVNIHEIVGTKLFNIWERYLSFKYLFIGCIVRLYQGMNAEEQQKMGERVAFYQQAVENLSKARKLEKYIEPTQVTQEALTFTNDVVEGKRKAAKNENEFIYHEEVPDKDLLVDLKPVCLVKALPINFNDPDVSGPDVFSRLVPMGAHEASSIYSEEKAKLLRDIVGQVEAKNTELTEFMSSLQIDQLEVLDSDQKIPQEIVDRCAAMNAKADVIQTLVDSMNNLGETIYDVEQALDEIKALIEKDTAEEKEYQQEIGPRPPSIVQTELSREYHKYREAHARTTDSNLVLHKAMTLHVANLRLLALPLDKLRAKIPSIANIEGLDLETMSEMRRVVGKARGMQAQRDALVQQLRAALAADDITGQLLARSNEPRELIFSQELEKHTPNMKIIEQNLAAQENIINKLTSLYASYAESRRLLADVLRKRDGLINGLMTSYDTHEELLGKSQKGLEFYRKLAHNVGALLTRVRSTCQVQREERAQLLAAQPRAGTPPAPAAAPSPAPVPASSKPSDVTASVASERTGPKLKDYLPYMKSRGLARSVTPQAQMEAVPPESYYPESIYPTSVRPAPVGSEATDMSQVQLTDGVAPHMTHMTHTSAHHRYSVPYNPHDTAPTYAHPPSSKPYDKPEEYYGYTSPYTPPQYSNSAPSQVYTNPYYSAGTFDNTTVLTDSQNPAMYNANVSQANMNPNATQYGGYADPYSPGGQTGPIPDAVSSMSAYSAANQTDLNASFARMQVSAPKAEPAPSYGQDYSQTFYSVQYPPQAATPNMATYSNAGLQSGLTIVSSQNPSDYSSAYNASQYGQADMNTNVSVAYSVPDSQYNVSSTYDSNPQGYAIYTNADTNMAYSSTDVANMPSVTTAATYAYLNDENSVVDPATLAHLDAIDKPIKSHVTGQALASNISFPSYQSYDANTINYNPAEHGVQPTAEYQYRDETNVDYQQSYQNHPGYSYNVATGGYDCDYGSQSSFDDYGAQQANIDHQSMVKGQNFGVPGVYNSAGGCDTVQSPCENPQTITQLPEQPSDGQNYYVSPYGYQSSDTQPNPPAPAPIPESTNYGANMNQSTYMQSENVQNISVPYSNNDQVSTPVENVPEPNFQPNIDKTNRDQSVPPKPETPPPIEPKPAETKAPDVKPEPSTFDLLSDIDFSVEHAPLMPEIKVPQISESAIRKAPITSKIELTPETVVKEEVLERPAKRELFSDPSLINKFTQEVKNLQKFVDSLTDKTPAGVTVLDAKWKSLQEIQAKENASRSKAIAKRYSERDIVADVVPYDDSRLTLKSDQRAYINASYYKQLTSWCIPLVIARNPVEQEYGTFWKAIVENNIACVVCLLSESEMQGKTYWPTAKGMSLELSGGLRVTLDEVNCTVHWTERKLTVEWGETVSNVTHYQINVYPAKIVCSPLVLLAHRILGATYDGLGGERLRGACVQCGAGAGRSAVLALQLAAACQVRAGQLHLCETLDAACATLCRHRTNVLEDTKYLADAYRTVLFYVQGVLCSGTTMFSGEAVAVPTGASVLPPLAAAAPPTPTAHRPPKTTRESFEEMRQVPGLKSGDMKDPLNFLDPLWSLKKK